MLPVLVCFVALVGLLVAERLDSAPGRAIAKPIAASAFVWAGIAWGGLDTVYGRWLLTGLMLCWLGDALLLPAGQSIWFQLGIAAFLLGHVAYALSFVHLGLDPAASIGFGLALAMAAAFALRWLRPHVPAAFRAAVVAYVIIISAMVVAALSAVAQGAPVAIAIGAVGFALSDLSVARDRFVSPGFANGAWGLPAYFASQLVLAYSIRLVASAQ